MADGWLAGRCVTTRCHSTSRASGGRAPAPALPSKALVGSKGTSDALRLVPGLGVTVMDAGCCGMAGAFGYEKEHYDVSVKIANLELIPALTAHPAAAVVATGTSCRHQIRDLTGRTALHPLEVLAGNAGG